MFTGILVGAILTVMQWVFWTTSALYLAAGIAMVGRRGVDAVTESLIMVAVLATAGFVCRFLRNRLAR